MATVEERISALETFDLVDGQPNIEGPTFAVAFESMSTTGYGHVDNKAFETKWTEEIDKVRQLQEILQRGDAFIKLVYAYRSCLKAIPQVKAQDDPNKGTIYEKTFEVLEPEIKKLKDLMYFMRDTVKLFADHVKVLAAALNSGKKKPRPISEIYIHKLGQMLDFFTIMNALKNMKASPNNDFSFFKRTIGFLRKQMTNDEQATENHSLYLFLAPQNSITMNLKTELQQINGFDDVLALVVNQCARYFEENMCLVPQEKHSLLRAMSYGLYLMDGDNEKLNVFKSKKISLSPFQKFFKKYPIVPLYGDMQFSLEQTIKSCPHYDEKTWGLALEDRKLAVEYEIQGQIDSIRTEYNMYLAKFTSMIHQINAWRQNSRGAKYMPEADNKAHYTTILEGLRLLSDWSGKVLLQSAWKYAHPNTNDKLGGEEVKKYERVVKHNYTDEERFALVEIIACLKGLAAVMLRNDGLLSPIIRTHIHTELQDFVQVHLREMIAFASKKKKAVREELLQLRTMAADWKGGQEPDDPALFGKKVKTSKTTSGSDVPERAVGPSQTQLDLIRTIVYGLVAHRYLDKKLEYSDKDYGSSSIKVMEEFLQKSFFYKYTINYTGTIFQVTDLADLWYREYWLELDKCLQFPIELSLPWILTDQILESGNSAMMEFLLYPLDLYNDAANRALYSLHQRFLYDEIEAEVNLCFDQLVFKVSEQIYTHFKIQASSLLLDKPYKQQLELIYSAARFHTPKSRYYVILKQRHFQLLGRSIDLNHLIGQRMNSKLRQNIDFAISRFEASDITTIIELETQLNNIRLMHSLLSEHLELDSFEDMLNEVNESTSLVSFHGRVILHAIFELVYDFFPNYNFNSITNRFVRSPIRGGDVPRESMPKPKMPFMYGSKALNGAYANVFQLQQHFVGIDHFMSLIRVLGRTNLPLLVGECLENLNLKIQNVLVPYVRELFVGMPPSTKLPMFFYGTDGNYGWYKMQLKDMIGYAELNEAFRHFKEFGNTIVFLNLLESAMSLVENQRFVQTAPFLGINVDNVNAPPTDQDPSASSTVYITASAILGHLEANPHLAKAPHILKDLLVHTWKADKLYRPHPVPRSLFKAALARVDEMVARVKDTWSGHMPDNGLLSVDHTTEFYRLWSALQFVFCLPTEEGGMSCQEKFGDGFVWGGITLVYLLQQEQRFRVFDFCSHILNVEEALPVAGNAKDHTIFAFLPVAGQVRDLNQHIFSTLHVFHPVTLSNILILHPPKEEVTLEFINHNGPIASGAYDTVISQSGDISAHPPSSGHQAPSSLSPLSSAPSSGSAPSVSPRMAAGGPPVPPPFGGGPSPRGQLPPPPGSGPSPRGSPSPRGGPPPPPLARDDYDAPPPLARDDFGAFDEEYAYNDYSSPPPLPRDEEVFDFGAPPPLPPDDFDYGPPPPLPRDDFGAPPPLPYDDFDAPPPLPRD